MCQYARQNNAEAVVPTDIKEQRNQAGSVFFWFFMGSENSGEVCIICIRGIDCPEGGNNLCYNRAYDYAKG